MKKYTTIFLDIDSITYELNRNRHMHDYTISMIEQILKKGLKSLQKFEVIALLGKKEDIGRKYLRKNRITFMKEVSKRLVGFTKDNSSYFNYLLKHYNRNKNNVLVVSGNPVLLDAAKLVDIDTCYFNIFNPNIREYNPNLTISKLEELVKFREVNKELKITTEEPEIEKEKYHFYVDQRLVEVLEQNNIILNNYDSDKNKILSCKINKEKVFAITVEPSLVKIFKEKGYTTYFVNNHRNDCVDYITDYESSIENLVPQLKKVIR